MSAGTRARRAGYVVGVLALVVVVWELVNRWPGQCGVSAITTPPCCQV